jgi:ATP adenylyltransferase
LKNLWAPWRYGYVSSQERSGCIFCSIAGDSPERDRDNLVLVRGVLCFAVLNRYPYINGHVMIVPFRHIPDFTSASHDETDEMMAMVRTTEGVLRETMKCQGINGGWNLGSAAGAGIPGHLHLHILPRWNGDTSFMSSVGGVRVLSQSLEQAWEQLSPGFRSNT